MKTEMPRNRVLEADSYKLSHAQVMPPEATGSHAAITPRRKGFTMKLFGPQMWIMKTLLTPITWKEVNEAEQFAKLHGEPFDVGAWAYLIDRYGGFLPLSIRAVPEGLPVPSGLPLVTIECDDPDLHWLVSYIETSLQRAVWYPTTVASEDGIRYNIIKKYLAYSSDKPESIAFMLHDFGARGCSSGESAEIGGAAHLMHFMGSDTMEGVRAANWYYSSNMAGFSVPATEHSVQTAYGPHDQLRYLETVLDKFAKPGAIVSIVLDGYDLWREAGIMCGKLKDKVINSEARVVFRPDSGDPVEIIERLIDMLAYSYGYTYNSKGFKVINNVGILQGDGIDTAMVEALYGLITNMGYAAENLVLGSGGGLLQKVNRDTFSFAQKVSAIRVGGQWKPVFKNPVTDPGKSSHGGRQTLLRSKMTGEFMVGEYGRPHDESWEDVMQVIYDGVGLRNPTTLDEIRARATAKVK